MMSDLNNIQILEPKSQDMSFFIGSTNKITYHIKNNGEFKIKDLELSTFTVKNKGSEEKPEYVNTEKNYAQIVTHPKILMPYETKEIRVVVNVPPQIIVRLFIRIRKAIRCHFMSNSRSMA